MEMKKIEAVHAKRDVLTVTVKGRSQNVLLFMRAGVLYT